MKLGKTVLVEIVDVVQRGILEMRDVSELLRELEVVERDGEVELSDEYLIARGRATIAATKQ